MRKTLTKKFEDLASAVAFAECGEWDYAMEFIGDFEPAAKSDKRKFIVMFGDKTIDQGIFEYAASLATRLCYDVVFLHTPPVVEGKSKVKASLRKIRDLFYEHYQSFVASANSAGIGIHYLVTAGRAQEALGKLYHRLGHVEFAIVQDGVGLDHCDKLGLPLFVYRP